MADSTNTRKDSLNTMADSLKTDSRAHGQSDSDLSMAITYSKHDVLKLVKEVQDDTIHEVNLTLFSCWICQKRENYEQVKHHIRELGVDLTYQTSRIENSCVRKLVEDAAKFRPGYNYVSEDVDEVAEAIAAMFEKGPEPESPTKKEPKTPGKKEPETPAKKTHFLTKPIKSLSTLRLRKSATSLKGSPSPKVESPPPTPTVNEKWKNLMGPSRQLSSPLRPRPPYTVKKPPSVLIPRSAGKAPITPTSASVLSRTTESSDRSFEIPPKTPDRPESLHFRRQGLGSEPNRPLPPRPLDIAAANAAHLTSLNVQSRHARAALSRGSFRSFSLPLDHDTAEEFASSPDPFIRSLVRPASVTSAARPTSSVWTDDSTGTEKPATPSVASDPFMYDNPEESPTYRLSDHRYRMRGQQTYDGLLGQYQLAPHEMGESTSNSPMRGEPSRPVSGHQLYDSFINNLYGHNGHLRTRSDGTVVAAQDSGARTGLSAIELYLAESLDRSRPVVDMTSLPVFERAWRSQNAELLRSLFGRDDVELSDDDVERISALITHFQR